MSTFVNAADFLDRAADLKASEWGLDHPVVSGLIEGLRYGAFLLREHEAFVAEVAKVGL